MTGPSPLRFFWVVLRPPPPVAAGAALVVAYGILVGRADPTGFGQAMGTALLFQMFAASTGYSRRAARGHFDPVLVGPASRFRVALAHCAVSVAPGLATWGVLGLLEAVVTGNRWPTAWMPSAMVAILYVSVLAWAGTLRFPRYAGGPAWIIGLFALAATHRIHQLRELFTSGGDSWGAAGWSAGAALVCPIFLLSEPRAVEFRVTALVAGAAVAAWAAGMWFIRTHDAALVEPS